MEHVSATAVSSIAMHCARQLACEDKCKLITSRRSHTSARPERQTMLALRVRPGRLQRKRADRCWPRARVRCRGLGLRRPGTGLDSQTRASRYARMIRGGRELAQHASGLARSDTLRPLGRCTCDAAARPRRRTNRRRWTSKGGQHPWPGDGAHCHVPCTPVDAACWCLVAARCVSRFRSGPACNLSG